tara:strand:- start:471 stop:1157 length:687 start_codon:yes stop_codon:yes gene_type:complete
MIRSVKVQKLIQRIMCVGYLGFFTLLGCGVDPAAVAVIGSAVAGSAIASTAQVDDRRTNEGSTSGGPGITSFDGIYHVSAMAAETSLVTCPASMIGWFEANGQTREIPRGFFLFMNCETQSLERLEIDGDFLIEDIDDDVCSQTNCLRLDLNINGNIGRGQRVWRGFLVNDGDGIVFAQVDPFNRQVFSGSAWRTFKRSTSTTDSTEGEEILDTFDDAPETGMLRLPG